MLKRLLVKLPLFILYFGALITCVIPLGYWIITGDSYLDIFNDICEM